MPRIEPTTIDQAPEATKETLRGIKEKLGKVPNLMATMGKSPATLNFYVTAKEALGTGTFDDKVRESLALAIANFSGCDYCASAHNAIGKQMGLRDDEREMNRKGQSSDPKTQACIDLAREIVDTRGWVSDEGFEKAKGQGLTEEEILELVTVTMFNLFTNYMNHFIETENDFPKVELHESAAV